jgi:hypothetical protein
VVPILLQVMMNKYILCTKTFLIILYKMDVYLKDWISFFKTHKTRLGPYDYEGSEMKHKFITNTIMVKHYVEK